MAFVRYVLSDRADGIHLEGEGEIAQDLRDFLAALDIDWEELLSRAVGDVPARLMMRTLEEGRQVARNFGGAGREQRPGLPARGIGACCRAPPNSTASCARWTGLRDDLERFEMRIDRIQP